MNAAAKNNRPKSARAKRSQLRFWLMIVTGIAAALATGLWGQWIYAPAAGWAVAAAVYNVFVWTVITPMKADQTRSHATEEDPRRSTADLLILCAAVGSLAAVVLVMIGAKDAHGFDKFMLALLALGGAVASWLLVHTLFTLRYAEVYYTSDPPRGIEFNQKEPPQYTDFAYMAFSLGMTYQVSDTSITTRTMRSAALRHSLLAYVFGVGILATTINLVVSLAS
ncbi:DUF1345 domain-containing protein [Arthrobacter sp. efr-133-TYG-118]|uniref:DUF1345 domain-containing protein n=1 Tax=Arthrobacter sp. efr-133-TYG-118 TaxID=3040279 RepID=UPI00254FD712|nr:DUF1345 domain-containing protein [Arthrobacter sp. efr-133-TYG-118]